MIIEWENYQIRPYGNELCWEIFEYKTVTNKLTNEKTKKWVSLGNYAGSIGYALEIIYEKALKADRDVVSLKQALGTAKRISASLRACELSQKAVDDAKA